jgi:hypothetical protein
MVDHVPLIYASQAIVAAQIGNYVKYPPRQKAASFNLDSVMRQLDHAMQTKRAEEAESKAPSTEKRAEAA